MVLVIQHSSGLEDLQVLVPDVLDGGKDLDVRRGCDLVGWSREIDLKTANGVRGGFGVGTEGGENKCNKGQGEHGDAKRSGCSWIEV